MTLQPPTHISREYYHYAAKGQRAMKMNVMQSTAILRQQQVRYLPGLEVRLTRAEDHETAQRRVMSVGSVRINHDITGKQTTAGLHVCFSLNDRTGSALTELDINGKRISSESYYPFGGTAAWATKNQTETRYKTLRYSGKERDVTGLMYYGYRYYAPWLMRWTKADPLGTVDGLNLFCMVKNNPATFTDSLGLAIHCPHCNEIVFNDTSTRIINTFDDISTARDNPNRLFVEQCYAKHVNENHPDVMPPLEHIYTSSSGEHPQPYNPFASFSSPLGGDNAPVELTEHQQQIQDYYNQPANLGGGDALGMLADLAVAMVGNNEERATPSLIGDIDLITGLSAAGGRAVSRATSRMASRVTTAAHSLASSARSSVSRIASRVTSRIASATHSRAGSAHSSMSSLHRIHPYSRSESVSSSATSTSSTPQFVPSLPRLDAAEVDRVLLQPQPTSENQSFYCDECLIHVFHQSVEAHRRLYHRH